MKKILYLKNFENSKLNKYKKNLKIFNNYSISKFTTEDILFSGNIGATGTAYIDFFNNDQNLLLTTYDGTFAYSYLDNLENLLKLNQILINS